jgi:hypothetical protein
MSRNGVAARCLPAVQRLPRPASPRPALYAPGAALSQYAAMRSMHFLAPECRWLSAFLRLVARQRRNAGVNTRATWSGLQMIQTMPVSTIAILLARKPPAAAVQQP